MYIDMMINWRGGGGELCYRHCYTEYAGLCIPIDSAFALLT